MDILNLAAALEMLDGEKELLVELMKAFTGSEPLDREKLLKLESLADRTEAAKYVHFYKGGARQIGAEKLANSGQELEDVLRGRSTGDISSLNEQFITDYEECCQEIREELAIL